MFDDLFKKLKQIERSGISIPVKNDAEGFLDRECPSPDCLFQFKVHGDDWSARCKEDSVTCVRCGHVSPKKSWWTKQQIEEGKAEAIKQVSATINQGFREGARRFNLNQRPGLVTMSMSVSGAGPTTYRVLPISALEAMKSKIVCEKCETRFAFIGSAFFCPCCGYNSVERTFEDSLKKVEARLDNLSAVRTALKENADEDTAELTCRSMIETGVNDCVVAFQKLMEALYLKLPDTAKPSLNTFQRLDDGSSLWKKASGEGYQDWLTAHDLEELNTLFNKRHLLAHTDGFVDEKYIAKSGDKSYAVGQRIVVKESDVRKLLKLVRILTQKAREKAQASV